MIRAVSVVAAVACVATAAPQLASAASVVAQAKGPVVSLYYSPESRQPRRYLASPNRHGVPLVFLVKKRRPGWVNVYLPTRPNGSTAWVHDWLLTLASNPYRVRVSRRAHTLTVWKGTSVVVQERVAVGRRAAPTPAGIFYISELLQQPNPRGTYGPYAFGTLGALESPLQLRRRPGTDRATRYEPAPVARPRCQPRLCAGAQSGDQQAGANAAARDAGADQLDGRRTCATLRLTGRGAAWLAR